MVVLKVVQENVEKAIDALDTAAETHFTADAFTTYKEKTSKDMRAKLNSVSTKPFPLDPARPQKRKLSSEDSDAKKMKP